MQSADRVNTIKTSANERPNNKGEKPLAYYREVLKGLDPQLISARTGLAYDSGTRTFAVRLIGRNVNITYPDGKLSYADTNEPLNDYANILLLRILAEGNLAPGSGAFIPYAKIGWGESYLKAFNGRCIGRLSHMFKSASDFAKCAEAIGGVRISSNQDEATYDMEFVNDVFMRLTIRNADEEFPMSAQILFSDNTPVTFTSEDAAVMGDILMGELSAIKKRLGL